MIRLLPAFLGLVLSVAAFAGERMEGGLIAMSRSVNPASGSHAVGGGMMLDGTVGETSFSPSTSTAHRVIPGYGRMSIQPGTITSITAVTKSTGSLDLQFNAPGHDGFKGDIVNGYYRVDYSSDPAHVFKPTIFQLQIPTSTVANSLQTLRIDNLEPNTTYYAKIYLADAERMFAEKSARADQSTLAGVPINPEFSGVFTCSATITWALPAGGAEKFRAEASTSSFLGGDLKAVQTPNGTQLTLTMANLQPGTTYFFKVASFNWQSERNYSAILSTVTPAGTCLPAIANLAVTPNDLGRRATFAWTNSASPAPNGVLILVSTSPITAAINDGDTYALGQVLADGSRVRSIEAVQTFQDGGLTLDSTYFYSLVAKYPGDAYSVSVSTTLFLDLAPQSPAAVKATLSGDETEAALTWTTVQSNEDGSAFPGAARPVELVRYEIERSTSVLNANWIFMSTVAANQTSYNVSQSTQAAIYRVVAIDSLGKRTPSMAVDVAFNSYVFAADRVTQLQIPPERFDELKGTNNKYGVDIVIRAVERPEDLAQNILKSVNFKAYKTTGGEISDFQFSKPNTRVLLSYGSGTGGSGLGTQGAATNGVEQSVGMFWDDNSKFVKLFGKVDPIAQTVAVDAPMLGTYQVRPLARSSEFTFDVSTLSNKMITPNGDGLNDAAIFRFDNQGQIAFSGKIFDVEGAFVADMAPGPLADSLMWDGKAGGSSVKGGVYVYQISAGTRRITGTLVVIK